MASDLREQLKHMGRHVAVPEHPSFIEKLRESCAHGIVVHQEASLNTDYRCFTYALGLHDTHVWAQVERDVDAVNTNWLEALIEREILRRSSTPTAGDVVVYFRSERPMHAGIWVGDDRVRSKWGFGWVYEHGLLEVPAHYGDTAYVYTRPVLGDLVTDFRRHIKTPERYWFGAEDDDNGWA